MSTVVETKEKVVGNIAIKKVRKTVNAKHNATKKVSKVSKKKPTKKKVRPSKETRKKFRKADLPHLKYGVIHSQYGYPDGVSIVMSQIDHVLRKEMHVPEKNIYYLVGKSKIKNKHVIEKDYFWDGFATNKIAIDRYQKGLGGERNEKLERSIRKAKIQIEKFVKQKKIDVIIAHNTSHPVNFVTAIALSRYYRDALKNKESTPKYILWWHDSHLERPHFRHPSSDVEEYLLEGVPGRHIEYILFINSTQFNDASRYLLQLDKRKPGFYQTMSINNDVIYNTTDTFIDSYDDLTKDSNTIRAEHFLEEFHVRKFLEKKGLTLSDVLFVLQHTRVIPRKRIDFALHYCFELQKELQKKKIYKAVYFFVSGHTGYKSEKTRKDLINLYRKYCREYGAEKVFLIFSDKENSNTDIVFEEYPRIFAKLNGISTYFSEIEGFGNNLLEVMASGLIPIVYTYPVFLKDIAKFNFKVIALNEFKIDKESIAQTVDVVKNQRKRKIWVNRNLTILKKNFQHKVIQRKLTRAIIRQRVHK